MSLMDDDSGTSSATPSQESLDIPEFDSFDDEEDD